MKLLRNLATALLLIAGGSAHAAWLVDTGPGQRGDQGASALYSGQALAGEFTISEDWVVNSVEGWINNFGAIGKTATIVLYEGGGDTPGLELYSSDFSSTGDSDTGWEGRSDLGWAIPSGTYWVAFEVRAGQTMRAAMPEVEVPGTPLGAYAFLQSRDPVWRPSNTIDFGVRIEGVAAVPLPAAAWLFGSALLGLAWLRRSKT
jgi:hypothetical protein